MNIKSLVTQLIYVLMGGVLFWMVNLPLYYLFINVDGKGRFVILVVFVARQLALPIWALGILYLMHIVNSKRPLFTLALGLLLCIWVLGPLFMTIDAALGNGSSNPARMWHNIFIGTLIFPIETFIMSTYDGCLFGLILSTFAMLMFPALSQYKCLKH